MKKLSILPAVILALSLNSCELVNQLIPDVEKPISNTYPIVIDSNTPTGYTSEEFIDITAYEEYDQYAQYITGYAIEKVTFTIEEFDAPDDLYFEGKVVAFDEGEATVVEPASLSSVNLADLANEGEQDLTGDESAIEQVVSWLEDPGSFNLRFEYSFENEDGTTYQFEEADYGSGFDLKITIYLVMITGA